MIEQCLDGLKYDKDGLIPGVVQDANNGDVLMVAYMNRDAVRETLTSGRACFWSRSRQTFWIKGETSGNIQKVKEVYVDCDKDCFVYDKGKFWNVPITDEENPELGEAEIAGTTGTFTFAGDEQSLRLIWTDLDERHGEMTVVFERMAAGNC